MSRLTERLDGDGCCYGKIDCEDNCSYCDRFLKVLDKLADFEDKQEQGLLIELPCKVGDTVWSLDNYCNDCHEYDDYCHRGCENPKYRLQEHTVRRIEITEYGVYLCSFDRHEMYGKLGKTVFLTRSEAEEALTKMGE